MNKKFTLIGVAMLFCIALFAQPRKPQVVQDTIFRLGGRQIICFVQQVKQFEVSYKFLNDPNVYTIDKKQIEKVVYRTGKIEEFNKPVFIEVDDSSWEAVWVTEDKDDVKGMYKYGRIQADSSPGARSKKKALNTATIRLQRKTANMKGNVILILKKEPRGGYGEPPSYTVVGDVYGYNPPPEEQPDEIDKLLD
jgi:hypothetical protein